MAVKKSRFPWVTFRIGGGHYCISSRFVSTMMLEHNFQHLPDSSGCILGVFEKLGDIIPVVDMHCLLGLPPAFDAKDFLLEMREVHLNWVQTLVDCMESNTPFPLERDAQCCGFGKWRATYQANNSTMRMILQRMDSPHHELHNIPNMIEACQANGDQAGAKELAVKARNLCEQKLLPLFEELIVAGEEANQGILIVLELGSKLLAIQVDEICGVMHFDNVTDESVSQNDGDSPYVSSIITNGGTTYLKLSADALSNLRD